MFFSKTAISIIIPIFNVENYIGVCLDSVEKATEGMDVQVLMIDDGSTDGSSDIAKGFASKNRSFKYSRIEHSGQSVARNHGLEQAKGEYVAFVDADDLVGEDYFARMLEAAKKYGCDMVITDVVRLKDSKITYSSLHRRAYYNICDLDVSLEKNPSLIFDSTVCNRLVKRSLLTDNHITFPEGYRYEDFPVVQRLHYYAKKVRFLRNWSYMWRVRTDGSSSITKSHRETKNLRDKIDTLEMVRSFARDRGFSSRYMRDLDYRILFLEFNGTIDALKDMDDDRAMEHLEIAADYIENNVDRDVISELPIYDRQKIDYILKRDLKNLLKLQRYKKANYDNAPIINRDGVYEFVLPPSIFPIPDRNAAFEHARLPSYQGIDSIEVKDGCVTLHAYIYLRRIDMPDPDSQSVKAYLVNYMDDGSLDLEAVGEPATYLTKQRGAIVNLDDYEEYDYNYDGTGFRFHIDIDAICREPAFRGANYIMAEVTNTFGTKQQILRYPSKKAKKTLTDCVFHHKGHRITISANSVDALLITVE